MDKVSITYKIIDFETQYLVGKKTTVGLGQTAIKFIKEFRTNGSNEYLQNLKERISPKGDIIIWMGDYNNETKSFIEIPGIFTKDKVLIKEDYIIKELPTCKMAILTVTGNNRNLTKGAHNKLVKLIKEDNYIPDYSYGYSMEYYSYDKFEKDNEVYEFSYYLPCKENK